MSAAILGVLCAAPLGALSDSLGRKPFIVATGVLTALPSLCLALTGNLWYYFAFTALAGMGGTSYGSYSMVTSWVADVRYKFKWYYRLTWLHTVFNLATHMHT